MLAEYGRVPLQVVRVRIWAAPWIVEIDNLNLIRFAETQWSLAITMQDHLVASTFQRSPSLTLGLVDIETNFKTNWNEWVY